MTDQSGTLALITGASSGIGRELARIHAAAGGDLVIVARSTDALNALAASLRDKHDIQVHVLTLDLTESGAISKLKDHCTNQGLTVDYLINNAGFGGIGEFYKQDFSMLRDMMRLNMEALTESCYAFLPDMVQCGSGRILNVSSTASLMPGPMQAVYFATKAYVTSFSNAIASELEHTGVTVTALLPGATETGFGARSGMDKTDLFSSTASAFDVAQAGYQAMLDGKLDVLAGLTTAQKIMIKAAPLTPKKVLLNQIKKMQTPKP